MIRADYREEEEPHGEVVVILYRKGIAIRADYSGGAYVDLTFGMDTYQPTEVINVWDDEKDEPEIPLSVIGVAAALQGWILNQDEEWPDWLLDYLDNQRY